MIIVIEGPDGTGKTTLAKQLASRYNLDYHHEGPPPKHITALEHYGGIVESYRDANIVFDRLALGELIYGPMLRGRDTLGGELGWKIFNRLLTAVGAVQVLCLTPYEVAHANWSSGRIELLKDEALFRTAYKGFATRLEGQHVYDYTKSSYGQLCAHIEHVERETVPLPKRYIGNPGARYLLVGYQGSNPGALHALPFFSVTNSSGYLSHALELAGYTEDEIALVNAYSHNHHEPVKILNFEVVIALGEAASHLCREQGVAHRKVPHPQYWKRFHYKDIDGYAEMLREVR